MNGKFFLMNVACFKAGMTKTLLKVLKESQQYLLPQDNNLPETTSLSLPAIE